MPRKEGPSIEERMQRAQELFEKKEKIREQNLKDLYASKIYRYARKSSIVLIWVTQLILIDWILPYNTEKEKVVTYNFNQVIRPNRELFIKLANGQTVELEYPPSSGIPAAGDTVVLYKSMLFNDLKRLGAPTVKENYLVTTAVTYKYLSLLLIGTILAVLFVFVRNIEVKAFAWIVAIFCTFSSLFFLYFLISYFFQ